MSTQFRTALKVTLVFLWVAFTVGLAGWWYTFMATHIRIEAERESAPEMKRQLSMLQWEGSTLVLCLVGAGFVLAYYILRDLRQNQRLYNFFLTFTHELKTPLASLHLQAESLREDLADSQYAPVVQRLLNDTARLTLQLENSLLLAQGAKYKLLHEELRLDSLARSLQAHWPDISITLEGDGIIEADSRALDCIFRNLIHNAITHGKATALSITCRPHGNGKVAIILCDNGTGFSGDLSSLGRLFNRPYHGSGNGIGLYLVRELTRRMNGAAHFRSTAGGFEVELELRGRNA